MIKHKKTVGIKRSIKAIEGKSAKLAILASDADIKLLNKIKELCNINQIETVYVDNMKQLGKSCGIEVGTVVVCLLE